MALFQLLCLPLIFYEFLYVCVLWWANEPGDYFLISILALFFWVPYHISLLLCKPGYPVILVLIPLSWLLIEILYLVFVLVLIQNEPSFRFIAGEPIPHLSVEIQHAYYSMGAAIMIQCFKIVLTQRKLVRWVKE